MVLPEQIANDIIIQHTKCKTVNRLHLIQSCRPMTSNKITIAQSNGSTLLKVLLNNVTQSTLQKMKREQQMHISLELPGVLQ